MVSKKKVKLEGVVLISATENKKFARSIGNYLGKPLVTTDRTSFKDTDLKLRIGDKETVRGKDVYLISTHEPPVADRLHELLVWTDALISGSANRVTLVLPYFFGSRQDRKTNRGEPINIRAYTNAFKGVAQESASKLGFLTGDLHSKQSQALAMDFDDLYALPLFANHINSKYKNYALAAPDANAVVTSEKLVGLVDEDPPIVLVTKTRNNKGKTKAYGIDGGDIKGKTAIILDDMIDSGGTLVDACKLIRGKGAKNIAIYATHLLLSGDAETNIKKLGRNTRIIGTDTVYHDPKKLHSLGIKTIPFSHVFAEAIKRKYTGDSTRELYNDKAAEVCGLEEKIKEI
jgi:ribose-phosphate pyrophosphokinase